MAFIYSIELALKKDCNLETCSIEFTKALELPKLLFPDNFQFMVLRYPENGLEKAVEDCNTLNRKLEEFGFYQVEFRVKKG